MPTIWSNTPLGPAFRRSRNFFIKHGTLEDHIPTDEELKAGFATIPAVPGIQAAGGLPIEE